MHEQHARIFAQLERPLPRGSRPSWSGPDPTYSPSPASPKEHWRQLWSNNSLERLNKEIRAAPTWSASSPRPRRDRPPRRRRARRTERRMGRRPPLHERRVDPEGAHRPRARGRRRRPNYRSQHEQPEMSRPARRPTPQEPLSRPPNIRLRLIHQPDLTPNSSKGGNAGTTTH